MIPEFSKTRLGFVICRVCGEDFPAEAARRYTVKERDGLAAALGGNTFYDAFDCPECGCQNVVGPRYIETGLIDREPTKEEIETFERETEAEESELHTTDMREGQNTIVGLEIDSETFARMVYNLTHKGAGEGPEEPDPDSYDE